MLYDNNDLYKRVLAIDCKVSSQRSEFNSNENFDRDQLVVLAVPVDLELQAKLQDLYESQVDK